MLRLMGNAVARKQGSEQPATEAEAYRHLADVFHAVLSEQSLDTLLQLIADALADIVPHDTVTIYWADEQRRVLLPVLARDRWAEQILASPIAFGSGITGWAVEHREVARVARIDLDSRALHVPGTPPAEPEALMCVPLIARGRVKGALNVYRLGEDADFTDGELELLTRFGDAAALALDNAEVRLQLEHQAQTDWLTGLYNHRTFHERLKAELARASRNGQPVAVLMIDIDDFKRINDVYGHGAGDEVLAGVARILRGVVRVSDAVCRVGGEEFAVVLPDADSGGAAAIAARVAGEVARTAFEPAGTVTVSVGVAHAPAHACGARELASCAEAAMMTAKAQGGGMAVTFSEGAGERPEAQTERDTRSLAHLKLLQSVVGRLTRLTSVEQIARAIVEELEALLDCHDCRVYVREGDALLPVACRDENAMEALVCSVGEGITGRAAATGRSVLVRNALECDFAVQVAGTPELEESMVAVPLTHAGEATGVIVVSKLGVGQLDEHDVRLLEVLTGHAAVVLENARLYESVRGEAERLERTLLSTLAAITDALEARDGHPAGHPRATADLALAVAEELGLDREQRRRLELAALLHDIGALAVPADVLRKEGPLSPDERTLVRSQPELGERILTPVEDLADVRAIIRHCREWWDGSGYPDGFAGEAIPIESRIVHVCDAYGAMTADRPYRPALGPEQALAELERGAGRQFDPGAVAAFTRALARDS
jgi:diguanylate cyclase (GGDEF)-like protein